MATQIEFTKNGGDYVCALSDGTSATKGIVHLALSEPNQIVSVWGGAASMPPMVVTTLQTPYGTGLVFELDFPEGVSVILRSSKPVINGIWIE